MIRKAMSFLHMRNTQVGLCVVLPCLLPLLYMWAIYKFYLYELVFWIEVDDIYPNETYSEPQYGLKHALRQIDEMYAWYIYCPIVWIIAHKLADRILDCRPNLIGYAQQYLWVVGIYVMSVFLSIHTSNLILFLEVPITRLPRLIFSPAYSLFMTMVSFTPSDQLYAPYALPALGAPALVVPLLNLVRVKHNNRTGAALEAPTNCGRRKSTTEQALPYLSA